MEDSAYDTLTLNDIKRGRFVLYLVKSYTDKCQLVLINHRLHCEEVAALLCLQGDKNTKR